MRIKHYSDTHRRHNSCDVEECDLFAHTGDFCSINFSLEASLDQYLTFDQASDFLEWVNKYPAKHKIICSGNHETFLMNKELAERFRNKCQEYNIIFKENPMEIIDIEGFKIAGSGFYPHISNRMPLDNVYFYDEQYFQNNIPKEKIHILLSHSCPKFNRQNEYECPEFYSFLEDRVNYFNPIDLVLCGHIHESRGEYMVKNRTKVINNACSIKPKMIEINK